MTRARQALARRLRQVDTRAAELRHAAHECVQHHHGLGIPDGCPLGALVPVGEWPDKVTFAAVYDVTGRTRDDRLNRAHKFGLTGATESGWARMELRRWAIRNPLPSTLTND